ncbi:hypothetical protein [Planomicrobium okeanokoites]|uniref:hypothetical protein n=1 Tax=Planomicrobium okeanokoites TaxID=244 RepID=UPI00249159F9|nr:hypothetical protein [Planomicrobium okeanokoites]
MLASAFFALFSQIKSFESTRPDRSEIISASSELYRRSGNYIGVQRVLSAFRKLYRRSTSYIGVRQFSPIFLCSFSLFACEKHVIGVLVLFFQQRVKVIHVNSLFPPAFSPSTAAIKADINAQEIISTFSEIYRRSKNYINAQQNISTFKNLYQRSHISPAHPPSPKHQNPKPKTQLQKPKTQLQKTLPVVPTGR